MKHDYWVDWLKPKHAAQVARLERTVYPKDYCAGVHSIRGDLRTSEANGRNLSMGIFSRKRLVGFLLAFHEPVRARICEYIDVEPPQGVDLSGAGIYLNDFVVHPDHRGAGPMMAIRLAQVLRTRDDLRALPVDTFSTNTMTRTWCLKVRFLKRMGVHMSENAPLRVKAGGEDLFWIVFRHMPPPVRDEAKTPALSFRLKRRRAFKQGEKVYQIGTITSVADWIALQPFWNELLQRSSAPTVFQTYEYLTTWWSLLGLKNELMITVVLYEERPVVIAPMQISRETSLGRDRRCLSFIGHPSEVDRNTLLADTASAVMVAEMARYHLEHQDLWDFIALYEQPPDSLLLTEFARALKEQRFIVTQIAGPQCATVDIRGSWNEFLAAKPKPFRKSVKRRLGKLESMPNVTMDSLDSPTADQATAALERYQLIEAASWKRDVALGVGKSASHRNFFTQIVRTFAATRSSSFQFLKIGDEDAAGTFGLLWARTFYSLHIAHDEQYSDYSPGVTLTALEMKAAFASARYDVFDFLGGFMSNKRSWATSTNATVALFAHPRGLNGWLFHSLHFRMRPRLRRFLIQFRLLEAALAAQQWVRKLRAR